MSSSFLSSLSPRMAGMASCTGERLECTFSRLLLPRSSCRHSRLCSSQAVTSPFDLTALETLQEQLCNSAAAAALGLSFAAWTAHADTENELTLQAHGKKRAQKQSRRRSNVHQLMHNAGSGRYESCRHTWEASCLPRLAALLSLLRSTSGEAASAGPTLPSGWRGLSEAPACECEAPVFTNTQLTSVPCVHEGPADNEGVTTRRHNR